jgi:hypothetical protein
MPFDDLPPDQWPQFVRLQDIDGVFETHEGLPHPRWDIVWQHLKARIAPEKRDDAYWVLAHQWLTKLAGQLQGEYEVHSSPNFLVLAAVTDDEAIGLMRFAEATRDRIIGVLGEPEGEWFGPFVVLVFADGDDFARYIAPLHPPEGEFMMPAGIFINRGYCHIAMQESSTYAMQQTLTHELAHNLLTLYPLPLWLNEGLVQVLTDSFMGGHEQPMDPELARKHRRYWTEENIQDFWSGKAFSMAGEPSRLSYSLAIVAARTLAGTRKGFADFIRAAHYSDAGESAAEELLGCSVGDAVAGLLGDGYWAPDPEAWETDEGDGPE